MQLNLLKIWLREWRVPATLEGLGALWDYYSYYLKSGNRNADFHSGHSSVVAVLRICIIYNTIYIQKINSESIVGKYGITLKKSSQSYDYEPFTKSYGGAGGNRTLVQTRNRSAFYMFSLTWVFDQRLASDRLSWAYSLYLVHTPGPCANQSHLLISSLEKDRDLTSSEDSSSPHLVKGLGLKIWDLIRLRARSCCCHL